MTSHHTWGILQADTPFTHLFPDRKVPLRSILPIIPREAGAPHCYLVPGDLLSEAQVRGLAELLWERWQPECSSVEDAMIYIRGDALPLRVDWFTGVGTRMYHQMIGLAELGERMTGEEEGEDDS